MAELQRLEKEAMAYLKQARIYRDFWRGGNKTA
jgi:hypothetical protein